MNPWQNESTMVLIQEKPERRKAHLKKPQEKRLSF